MVLLKAAPRHAAGYAFIELGAASIRISLPDELQPPQPLLATEEPPRKKARTSTDATQKPQELAQSAAPAQSAAGDALASVALEAAPISTLTSAPASQAQPAPTLTLVPLPPPPLEPVVEASAREQVGGQSEDELPSAHTTSRTGAAVTSSSAAEAPADPNEPLHCMPNLIARARARAGAEHDKRRIYVADQLLHACADFSSLNLRSPIDRGFITDWAAQKVLLDRAVAVSLAQRALAPRQAQPYSHAMAARAARMTGVSAADVSVFDFGTDLESRLLEDRTVIITEPYFNLPDPAAAVDIMMFEQYGAAALWRVTPAQLVPFAPIFARRSNEDESGPEAGRAVRLSGPDCLLVVDLGHSSTNVVPLICAQAQWSAARRLDIGGKLLTNLLKETLSFRQWDVMDETWLVQAVKERCCFLAPCTGVAADEGDEEVIKDSVLGPKKSVVMPVEAKNDMVRRRRDEILRTIRALPPRRWGLTLLVELCKWFPASNPVTQDYVLPDYSESANPHGKHGKGKADVAPSRALGYVRRGPGSRSISGSRASRRKSARTAEDDIVADMSMPCEHKAPQKKKTRFGTSFLARDNSDSEDDSDEDEDADGDFAPDDDADMDEADGEQDDGPLAEDQDADEQPSDEDSEGSLANGQPIDDDAQILKMGSERFSVPEVLFAPGRLGLAQAPLHEVIAESIRSCPGEIRDMMWSNIVLVGGGARLPGLRRRLEHELRSLAPDDVHLHFWEHEEPEKVAALGALALLRAPRESPEASFFRAHLVTRTEWTNAGAAVCRARFGGWMAMHDSSTHIRRQDEEDEDEDGGDGPELRAARPMVSLPTVPEVPPAAGPAKVPGRRGRPPKAKMVAMPYVASVPPSGSQEAPATVPKKRGRPKGSKTKPKAPVVPTFT